VTKTSHRRVAALAVASFLAGAASIALTRDGNASSAKLTGASASPPVSLDAAKPPPPASPDARQLDGRAFPDGVLALTWDDGPDTNTLALAEYLADEKVSATFFVVNEWVADLSSDPGTGRGVFESGYRSIPILDDVVKLGHRVGNHTLNHVLLDRVTPEVVVEELGANQEKLDPFVGDELRMFRVPGGAWSEEAAKAVAGDPRLAGLVGPFRWDVDRKDWENAVECNSDHPAKECERTESGGTRVKARVTAERYLASIDEAKHGIVLFHDRVGDVGSDYALQIARIVVPALKERGYTFAAPVLGFSPLKVRRGVAVASGDNEVLRGDLNGDGRDDECRRVPEGFACALATGHGLATPSVWARGVAASRAWLADINGDGRGDLCVEAGGDVACGLAP
jgi:peptidoglycan/xylan/chitin deacetylase (PgdA/CDA1 family)